MATAAIQSFSVTANTTGIVVPASQTEVNFTIAGQLVKLDAQVGEKVTRGTVLASLDPTQAQSGVTQAQAALAGANAALLAAQSPLDPTRAAQLRAAVTSAQNIYDETVASVNATNAQDTAIITSDSDQLGNDQTRFNTAGCQGAKPPNPQVCPGDQSAIDADQLRLQLDESRAPNDASTGQLRILQAQSALTQAQQALEVAQTPVASQVSAAQANVTAATARLQAAQARLASTTLVAPAAGTVLQVNGQVGENVTGAATATARLPGTNAPLPSVTGAGPAPAASKALVVIGNSANVVIAATFSSTTVKQLAPRQTGTITAEGLDGLSIPCHILAIAQNSTVVDGVPTFYVSVLPDQPSSQLADGQTVNISIAIAQAKNTLAVPQSAIYLLGGSPHVDVSVGKRLVPTPVTTGLQGATLIQITSGLSAGQQVVLSAFQGLSGTATSVAGSS